MDINLTLLGQSIAMLVFVWFCMKFIWPPVMNAIEERQTKIADGLAAAERGQQSLDSAKAEAGEIVARRTEAGHRHSRPGACARQRDRRRRQGRRREGTRATDCGRPR